MQNKYLIKATRKSWFWFWTQLMNGFAPSDLHGNYKRPKGITIDSEYDINNENIEKNIPEKGPLNFIVGSLTSFLLFIFFYFLSNKIAIYF